MAHLLETLNPVQREAACAPPGPLLVLAGAGSGKTRVLTCRILWLMTEGGVPPEAIVGLTFTNKAAEELRGRLGAAAGEAGRRLVLHTFHALGVRILRQWGSAMGLPPTFTILDDDDALDCVRDVMRAAGSTGALPPGEVRRAIGLAKAEGLDPAAYAGSAAGDARAELIAPLYARYERALKAAATLDFDDLIVWPERLLTGHPAVADEVRNRWRHVLVDEYQDTSPAQYRLLRALIGAGRDVTCVGDPDQSIYGWRGADIRNILEFERDFPDARVVTMEQNYRSTGRILEAASALIAHNERRKPKRLWTAGEAGRPIAWLLAADESEEAAWIAEAISRQIAAGAAAGDLAVLYRTHAQSRPLEEAFVRRGLPYALIGGVKFYARREVKDLLAYLRLLVNPWDAVSLARALGAPPRGVGEGSIEKLVAAASAGAAGAVASGAAAAATEGRPVLEVLADPRGPALPTRARQAVRDFLEIMDRAARTLEASGFAAALAGILESSGYLPWTVRRSPGDAAEREDNLRELLAAARSAEEKGVSATQFLETAALMADIDRLAALPDRVTLMTLHNAKGLEFPHVIVCGLEEGLLPHASSLADPDELEEERRLLYVGLTRARESVVLTAARGRRQYDRFAWGLVSRFVSELPSAVVASLDSPSALPLGLEGPAAPDEPDDEPAEPSELERVPVEDEGTQSLRPGEEVRHPRFGSGKVLKVTGRGPDARILVSFPRAGTKTLLAKLSHLSRMEEYA
ncbi:MAG: UvrD-helicase domain-containing protein [Candidatus Coatesbacteria bacterium]